MKISPVEVIETLKEGTHYKFLGVLENIRQEGNLTLDSAAKVYQQGLSIIWSNRCQTTTRSLRQTYSQSRYSHIYLMWTQVWPIAELQRFDRASRKVMI